MSDIRRCPLLWLSNNDHGLNMPLNLNQLRIFLACGKHRTFSEAAQTLFLTQPAVSIQLKKFQEQFPIPLTEIIGRKLYVTTFGEEIAQAARKILNEVAAINHRSNQYQGKLAGKLSIAVVSTGKYLMPYYLSDFVTIQYRV